MLVGLGLLFASLPFVWRRKHRLVYLFCFSLFWLYVLMLTAVVFFPIWLSDKWPANITAQNALLILSHMNLIPLNFGDLFSSNPTVIFEQLVGNVVVTLPFGFGLPFLTRVSTRRMLWTALSVGLALEGMQLILMLLQVIAGYGHAVDINDTLLNALGVLVGYGLFRGFAWLYLAVDQKLAIPHRGVFIYLREITE